MYRHGDLLLFQAVIPAEGEEKLIEGNVLAEGEATGHAHRLEPLKLDGSYMVVDRTPAGPVPKRISGSALLERQGQTYVPSPAAPKLFEKNGEMYFRLEGTTVVKHEEHSTIVLPPGTYINRRQREYQPGAVPRNVAD